MSFIKKVNDELHMTKDDLSIFSPPPYYIKTTVEMLVIQSENINLIFMKLLPCFPKLSIQ